MTWEARELPPTLANTGAERWISRKVVKNGEDAWMTVVR